MVRFPNHLSYTLFIVLPRSTRPAPGIAIDYWRLPRDATMRDVVYAVRSDETTHRFVNHSLANLNTKTDVNPFALREPDMFVKGTKIEYVRGYCALPWDR
jgi:ubiquinol oxidase